MVTSTLYSKAIFIVRGFFPQLLVNPYVYAPVINRVSTTFNSVDSCMIFSDFGQLTSVTAN